jgi:hypothetical protein
MMQPRLIRPELIKYIKQISVISGAMLHRLAETNAIGLPELAEILEDTGNHFTKVANEVRSAIGTSEQQVKSAGLSLKVIVGGRHSDQDLHSATDFVHRESL